MMLVLAACSAPRPAEMDLAGQLLADRRAKDVAFRTASDSPVPPNRRDEFLPLVYFPPDPAYNVPALLRQGADQPVGEMPTSTGTRRLMKQVGTLEFTLKGRPMKLAAFVEASAPDVDRLFVPFTDLTSGTETYAAGRYLDLDRTATGIYNLDFNRGYNPYCYFNPTYECPFPPPENRLPIPVRAGERVSTRGRSTQ